MADIFRQIGPAYRQEHADALSRGQRCAISAIECCRTAALGGHVEQCDACGHQRISFNSCRSRHCPKCQSLVRAQWLEDRQAELLPVEYFHVVFTVPQEIAAIAYQNKDVVYDILFRATAETLRTIAADPKHLGAEIGFIAILHTWGQSLLHHPHLHCVVPGGGVSPDGERWIACRGGFFLPVRVLSRLFRRLFLTQLQQAFDDDKLHFFNSLAALQNPAAFAKYLAPAKHAEWVVYAKRPLGGPQQVLAYLGRYTHRVAISNNRLVDFADGKVTFAWKDYRHESRNKLMRLDAQEFIRRFLLHVLPPGFQRIRHYGLLANRHRETKLDRCRQLLARACTSRGALRCATGLQGPLPAPHGRVSARLPAVPAGPAGPDGVHRNPPAADLGARAATYSLVNANLLTVPGASRPSQRNDGCPFACSRTSLAMTFRPAHLASPMHTPQATRASMKAQSGSAPAATPSGSRTSDSRFDDSVLIQSP